MNDDNETELFPGRSIAVRATIIRQAWEHLQDTKEPYVTLQFVGVPAGIEVTCVGVSTRRLLTYASQSKPSMSTEASEWTLEALTSEVILNAIQDQGPITARDLGDFLRIPGSDVALRQRVHRVVKALVHDKALRLSGNRLRPKYAISSKLKDGNTNEPGDATPANEGMPVRPGRRPGRPRKIGRNDVTEQAVIEQLQTANGPISSRTIGDMLEIPRPDAAVRAKVSEHIRNLINKGRIEVTGGGLQGGRVYELIEIEATTTQASE